MSGHRRHLAIAAVLIAAIVVLKSVGGLPHIDLEGFLQNLSRKLGRWTYLLVGVMAFLETGAFIGLVAPGEFAVILGGVVAGQGEISVGVMLGIVWFAAWAGDTVSFLLGAKLGRGFVLRHGHRIRITPERFAQVERYFAQHGGKTILIGRFIGLVRALAPFTAGSSRMRYRAFVPFCIIGTGLWSSGLVLLGYFFSQSLDKVAGWVGRGTLAFGMVVGTLVGVVLAVRFLRVPANRERLVAFLDRTPVLRLAPRLWRPFWGVAEPHARFVWARLTPGRLGLEFSTVIAALSVGVYVVAVYAGIVAGDPGPTPGDGTAFTVGHDITTGWLTSLLRVVTRLGDGSVAVSLALAASVWLTLRRRWIELGVVLVGLAGTIASVWLMKNGIDRPRPGTALTSTEGYAFPSGHAAYSVIYPVLAVVAARVVPSPAARFALVAVGLGLAIVVGLSRVYLRAHYLSDVLGGWAISVSAFALCAATGLVVGHLRQNGRNDDGASAG